MQTDEPIDGTRERLEDEVVQLGEEREYVALLVTRHGRLGVALMQGDEAGDEALALVAAQDEVAAEGVRVVHERHLVQVLLLVHALLLGHALLLHGQRLSDDLVAIVVAWLVL